MADIFSRSKRSQLMAGVGSKNTAPERQVRSILRSAGFGNYRLNLRKLAGAPDIVFPKYRIAIFVHGCFWHQHPGCRKSTIPVSNRAFWKAKLEGNKLRDRSVRQKLRKDGWKVRTIWQCKLTESCKKIVKELKNLVQSEE